MTLLTHRLQTLEQVRAFLDGTDAVELVAADRQAWEWSICQSQLLQNRKRGLVVARFSYKECGSAI